MYGTLVILSHLYNAANNNNTQSWQMACGESLKYKRKKCSRYSNLNLCTPPPCTTYCVYTYSCNYFVTLTITVKSCQSAPISATFRVGQGGEWRVGECYLHVRDGGGGGDGGALAGLYRSSIMCRRWHAYIRDNTDIPTRSIFMSPTDLHVGGTGVTLGV